jgi:hypothetical protein
MVEHEDAKCALIYETFVEMINQLNRTRLEKALEGEQALDDAKLLERIENYFQL